MKLNLILLLLFFVFQSLSFAGEFEDIKRDFDLPKGKDGKTIDQRTTFFLIGKIENHRVQIVHFNDLDFTGGLAKKLGYPKTDDIGRTSGLVFKYFLDGSDGSLEINLQNWLFTNEIDEPNHRQFIEEESTVTIRSRLFLDGKKNQYIIIGLSFTNRVQKPFVLSYLQKFVHSLNGSTKRHDIGRPGDHNFLNAIIGYGGRYDILKYRHVAFYFVGEAELSGSTDFKDESGFTVRASANLDLGGWQGIENPILHVRVYYETTLFLDSLRDENFGVEVFLGVSLWKLYLQAGLYVCRFDSALDRRYEGKPSWNTGIFIMMRGRIPDEDDGGAVIKSVGSPPLS